jgi:hypothetical protein
VHVGNKKINLPYLPAISNFYIDISLASVFRKITFKKQLITSFEFNPKAPFAVESDLDQYQENLLLPDALTEGNSVETILFSPDGTQCAALLNNTLNAFQLTIITNPQLLKLTLKQYEQIEKIFLCHATAGYRSSIDHIKISEHELSEFPELWQRIIKYEIAELRKRIFDYKLRRFKRLLLFVQKRSMEKAKNVHLPFMHKGSVLI